MIFIKNKYILYLFFAFLFLLGPLLAMEDDLNKNSPQIIKKELKMDYKQLEIEYNKEKDKSIRKSYREKLHGPDFCPECCPEGCHDCCNSIFGCFRETYFKWETGECNEECNRIITNIQHGCRDFYKDICLGCCYPCFLGCLDCFKECGNCFCNCLGGCLRAWGQATGHIPYDQRQFDRWEDSRREEQNKRYEENRQNQQRQHDFYQNLRQEQNQHSQNLYQQQWRDQQNIQQQQWRNYYLK